ncbi:Predicted membrane protein [Clostridium uliginosum]|uniref:Predicted membrane protein n=2 Tax=Clostridium uliginosum TaxID=119641 RepID=A0A1I1JLC0_9CLOT|nr:Predicted membrane protein [Clostridium uliginosum]
MTEAAMLSAAFVVISILAIGTGLGYAGYLDVGVPVIIVLIYLRCGFKYTLLSGLTSLLLVVITVGDMASAICMSQGMILGIACGILIPRKQTIYDDLFYGSIFACFVMVIVDINFSTLIGYSFISECQGYLSYVSFLSDSGKQGLYYLLIGSLPIGTMFITYFLSILLGKRFKLLNDSAKKKYLVITRFKNYGAYMSCSKKTMNIGIAYIIIISIIEMKDFLTSYLYIDILLNSIKYIMLFFVIQDCYTIINRFMYSLTKSRIVLLFTQMGSLYMLINFFKLTSIAMILFNLIIEKLLNVRSTQIEFLDRHLT